MNKEEYFALRKEYKQIVNEAYDDYCKSFKNQSILDQYSFDIEPNTIEMFVDKCKHNIEYSIRHGLKIEERELDREERYDLMPELTGHHPENIAMRKQINNWVMDDGSSYHEEWLDSFGIPNKFITLTYNNKTIEGYVYDSSRTIRGKIY